MRGYDVPSSPQDLFGISLDIAGPLNMSMEGPPPTPGVNIHLQTPTKQLEEQQQQHQNEDTVMKDVDAPRHDIEESEYDKEGHIARQRRDLVNLHRMTEEELVVSLHLFPTPPPIPPFPLLVPQ
ncbi:hypothetical protein E2C01_074076 [Portunus trituberculatus]|uniref:Uncharacterized protein n=1 Tax=Portunus trituberculatus TaxID=210409 RepID=A0A5B7ICB3_PORTR|nr:hypothetical protein [Portunus trituberculatus]